MQHIFGSRRAALHVLLTLTLCVSAAGFTTVVPSQANVHAEAGLYESVLGLLQDKAGGKINVTVTGPLLRDALKDIEDEAGEGFDQDQIESLIAGLAAMKSTGSATPGMNTFVANVTRLIDEDMAHKVMKAHNQSQKVMDTVMNNFYSCKASKVKADDKLKLIGQSVVKSSKGHKTCRKNEQNWWKTKTGCSRNVRAMKKLMLSKCRALKEATKNPHTEADVCHTTPAPEPYGNWLVRNFRWFKKTESSYNKTKTACDIAKADHDREKPRCDKKIRLYKKRKASCNAQQATLEGSTCSLAKLMYSSCDQRYWGCYEESLEMYHTQVPILRVQEKDRKTEWRALMRIKCLLGVFAGEDGEVDASVIDTCKVKVHSTKHLNLKILKPPTPERCQALPNVPCSTPFIAQQYKKLPKNAKASTCSQCVVFTSGFATRPIYWLEARNYHPETKSWHNRGTGPDIRNILKYGSRPWIDVRKGYGSKVPVTSLMGTWTTGLDFGNIFPSSYTICSLTRYTGGYMGRILNGGRPNWLHGHWLGRAGVAHYSRWKTHYSNKVNPKTNWVAMCGRNGGSTPGNFMVNGKLVGVRRGGSRPARLAVNYAYGAQSRIDRSNFAIAEIIIFQESLPDAEMSKVMQHLMGRLKPAKKPGPDKEYKTKATLCTAPQLSKLDPGQKDHRSFRCNDGQCIPLRGMCNGFKNCADGSDETVCSKKKPKPDPNFQDPSKMCTIKQRLKLRKNMGDDRTYRCNDGTCVHIKGRCNGFKNCADGSDEKGCYGKTQNKVNKDETLMVVKYTKRWPHCTNIRCFGNTKVADAKKWCLKNKRCDGFSFTASRLFGGRGGGCYKQKCKVDSIKGYGYRSHGYIVKMKKVKVAKCQNLMVTYPVWGSRGKGLDFSAYTKKLRWIGCMGNGCRRDNFYCKDSPDTIEFGAKSGVLRALLGDGIPTGHRGCCSKSNPDSICNAMDQDDDIDQLCKELGYLGGKVIEKKNSNTCPEVAYTKTKLGNLWSSDFKRSAGYGYKFKCEGIELDMDSDMEFGIQMGMKKVSEWTDDEKTCTSQIPKDPWGDCADKKADKIGIQITYESGYMGFATYEGVKDKWGTSFTKIPAKVMRGFFQSYPSSGLHYLNYGSYPIAWSGLANLWSSNFDLTSNPRNCHDGKADKKGWGSAKFQLYCKA